MLRNIDSRLQAKHATVYFCQYSLDRKNSLYFSRLGVSYIPDQLLDHALRVGIIDWQWKPISPTRHTLLKYGQGINARLESCFFLKLKDRRRCIRKQSVNFLASVRLGKLALETLHPPIKVRIGPRG